ncbi:MAG: 50S ribosomal protein L17 [Deltaproteobacteria bacterium]
MRHLNTGRKFDRNSSNREAMFKNMVANLLAHGQIETTVPKAKEIRRLTERVITRAKRLGPDLVTEEGSARRLAVKRDIGRFLPRWGERLVDGEPERLDMVEHLFREVAPRYLNRPGGYTQILKTRNRRGDNAEMALLRLMPADVDSAPAKSVEADATPAPEAVRTEAPKAKKAAKTEG